MSIVSQLIKKIQKTSSLYLATILFFICIILYINTLGNGLFFDDEQFIYKNPNVIQFSLQNFFTQSLTPQTGQPTNYYRPLLFLTFGFEYAIFSDAPFIYHFDNMVLHGLCAILLYLVLIKIFKNKPLGFLTALLFTIHPIQTEAVSYANSRGDSLALLFILLTLYLLCCNNTKYYFLSLLTFLCALLSKETAIITPFLVVLTIFFSNSNQSLDGFRRSIQKALAFFLILSGYVLLRLTILNFNNTLNFWGYETVYTTSLFVRLNTFLSVLPLYVSLLIAPITLFIERDATISIPSSITASTIAVLSCFIGLLFFFWKIRKKYPVPLFCLLWFTISFGPTSGIIPINGIFYEHFLYIPSIGFFLLLSYLVLILLQKTRPFVATLIFVLLIAYILLLSFRTILRNNDWHDPIKFYTQTLMHAQTARIYNNLAIAYAETHNYTKSIPLYKKAIQLSDTYAETHYNLGNAYKMEKSYTKAVNEYKKSLEINKWFIYPYIQLYETYSITKNIQGITEVSTQLKKLGETNTTYILLLRQLEEEKL